MLLDSAEPLIWKKWLSTGIFSGITTNPTLLKQAKQSCNLNSLRDLAKQAEDLGCKEIHFQAWGETYEEQSQCGLALSELATRELSVYVKVPITFQGSRVAQKLVKSDISITFTACYQIEQVLIAAAIGVTYIAPYLGRISDTGIDAFSELVSMQRTLESIDSNCRILVASVRDTSDLIRLANEGLKTFTISPKIADELFNVSETVRDSEEFERAAKEVN